MWIVSSDTKKIVNLNTSCGLYLSETGEIRIDKKNYPVTVGHYQIEIAQNVFFDIATALECGDRIFRMP